MREQGPNFRTSVDVEWYAVAALEWFLLLFTLVKYFCLVVTTNTGIMRVLGGELDFGQQMFDCF